MFEFAKARTNMVDCQIHTNGVITPEILRVFETVPRESFVPKGRESVAYIDEDLIEDGRIFLMEPMIHGKLLEALQPQLEDVVLDIGCMYGYSSAILSPLVTTVLALEEDVDVLAQAEENWSAAGTCNIAAIHGDLTKGVEKNAPYDLIVLNGTVSEIPINLVKQLKEGGRMATILKPDSKTTGKACIVEHLGDGKYSTAILFDALTPYLKGFEPKPVFSF